MKTEPKYCWYALKVFYNKVFELEETLAPRGVETYIPIGREEVKGEQYLRMRTAMKQAGQDRLDDPRYIFENPHIYKRVPLIGSVMFVRCPDTQIKQIRTVVGERGFVYLKADGKSPAVIPDREMAAFRLVADHFHEGMLILQDEAYTRFREGGRVRVKEGPFKGAEGYIKRIRKDRRLLVAIEGVIAVATSYIPPENLEPVPEPEA